MTSPPGDVAKSFEVASGGTRTFEVGKVLAWDGTLVTVRHYGWSVIRADHPARHGLEVAAFIREMGLWWGGLMTSLREHVDER